MNALGERIARLIATQGPITVAQYMTTALHDREYGYYAIRDPLGARGDFITAPEVSQMFGELLGLWCAQVWEDQGRPTPARIVELGPGRGTLMRDALRALRVAPDFLAAIDVVLVESNPRLAAIQRQTLVAESQSISWTDGFVATLADRPVFVLANEFVDALPIRQFVRTSKGWCERMVGLGTAGDLAFALAPEPTIGVVAADRPIAPVGAIFEFSSGATALAGTLAQVICRSGGAALIVDYGYDTERFDDTLQALARHRAVGLLDRPGEADLSAHVDFAALASAAKVEGASVFGPVNQGTFLADLGITVRAERLSRAGEEAAVTAARDLDRLTAPDKMGSLFKALAILPGGAPRPPGF